MDYEEFSQRKFQIQIIAVDSGNLPLNSTTILTIYVTDVNDNAPNFYQAEYKVEVIEGTKIGQTIATITAKDKDEGDNAKVAVF